MDVKEDLIFDIGLHKGEDTEYYLKKGYKVVAVDANPNLVNYCILKFKDAVASGRLTILNVGLTKENGVVLPFYVNHYNSEWSSFDKETGTRNNSPFEIINVPCVTAKSLFEKYGLPYYLKVDIEGNDFLCLDDIPEDGKKPRYVSCEAVHIEWLDILKRKGYQKFKLINQADGFNPINLEREKRWYYPTYRRIKDEIEKKVKKIVNPRYADSSSGPFGEDSKGSWKSYEEIRQLYIDYFQGDLKTPVNNVSWWDFHACFDAL
jgi:FkbM family methyltransferase